MKFLGQDRRAMNKVNNGWIKLHRSLLDWEWYDEPNTFRVFMHILLKANHSEKRYRGELVKSGTLLTGQQLLAEQLGLSRMQIRTALDNLKITNEITIKSSAKGYVIEVVRYLDYQMITNSVATKQPIDNQPITSNKKDKNDKKENNKSNTSSNDDAETVWKAYPNKQGKKRAIPAIKKALKKYSVDELKTKIDNYVKTCRDPKYIAHGCTWFCNERYEDDLTPIETKYQSKFGSL